MTKLTKTVKAWLAKREEKSTKRLQTEFLPEALEIVEKAPSPLGFLLLWLILALMAIALLWAFLGEVDEVAIARGRIVAENQLQVVQPMWESRIVEILVEEGQVVTAGQPLIRLDVESKEIQQQMAEETTATLTVQNRLFAAFLRGEELSVYLNLQQGQNQLQAYQMIAAMQRDYLAKQQQYLLAIEQDKKAIEIQTENIVKVEKLILALENQIKILRTQVEGGTPAEQALLQYSTQIAQTEKTEQDYHELYTAGVITKVEWEEKQQALQRLQDEETVQKSRANQEKAQVVLQLAEAETQFSQSQNDLDIAKVQKEQSEARHKESIVSLETLKTETETQIQSTLMQNDIQLEENKAQAQILQKQIDDGVLCAPVDGIVQSLEMKTVGGVVTPAQPLVTIAPTGTTIVVEATLPNKEIGFVWQGQKAAIKMDTYPFQQYGTLAGTVIFISPDAKQNEQGQMVYTIRVALEAASLPAYGKDNPIQSGMEGTVELKVGRRKIIRFFLDPFIKSIDESLKIR